MDQQRWENALAVFSDEEVLKYEADIHELMIKHGFQNLTRQMFMEFVLNKYTLDVSKVHQPLRTLFYKVMDSLAVTNFRPPPVSTLLTGTSARNLIPSKPAGRTSASATSITLNSAQGRSIKDSVDDTTSKLSRIAASGSGKIIQPVETPVYNPERYQRKKLDGGGDRSNNRTHQKESGTYEPRMRRTTSGHSSADFDGNPAVANDSNDYHNVANSLLSVPSHFSYDKRSKNAKQKRIYETCYGEPLYPADIDFDKLATLPPKRMRRDRGQPMVNAPTIHERCHIKDPSDARKADFLTYAEKVILAISSITLLRPTKSMVEQFQSNSITRRIPYADLEIFATGLMSACHTLGTLNTSVKCRSKEKASNDSVQYRGRGKAGNDRDGVDETLCSAFLALPKNWTKTDTSTTKRQENLIEMAALISTEIIRYFDQFHLPSHVARVYPHVVNMTRLEMELLTIGILTGWRAALQINNSLRAQSVGVGTPLHHKVVTTLEDMELFRMPPLDGDLQDGHVAME